jgi:hypothetical protein
VWTLQQAHRHAAAIDLVLMRQEEKKHWPEQVNPPPLRQQQVSE